MSDPKVFCDYGGYYQLLYRDKDYVSEAFYIKELLSRHNIESGNILEFGSGTGEHGRLLAGHGYTVHGIERSAAMLAKTDLTEGFTCQQGDICTVKLGRKYDVILSLFHVVSYQVGNSEIQGVFENAALHLSCGGLFIFDFWYTPAVYAQMPSVRVKRCSDEYTDLVRIAEPEIYVNESRVDVTYTIFARDKADGNTRVFKERHPMRHFSLQEIDLLAQVAGFRRVTTEGFLTKDPPGPQTWGVCVTLEKVY